MPVDVGRTQVCADPNFPLSGRFLPVRITNALASTPLSGARTYSDIVTMIVSTTNGVTTIDFILESILQTTLTNAGLISDWNNLYVLISLCARRVI